MAAMLTKQEECIRLHLVTKVNDDGTVKAKWNKVADIVTSVSDNDLMLAANAIGTLIDYQISDVARQNTKYME